MTFLAFGITVMLTATQAENAPAPDDLRKAVIFYASFDQAVQADIAGGQATLDTRSNHPTEPGKFVFEKGFNEKVFRIAKDKGISGGALEVVDVLPNNGRVFFPAKRNLPFDPKGWEGALSVWCKTDPNKLLKTTFCDPIQITEKGANNGGLWFDFNNVKPRDMRHGAYPAVPADQKPIAEDDPQAPLVQVGKVDWQANDWHHVVLTWSNFDTGKNDAVSKIYIDGKPIGEIRNRPLAMQWDLEKTGIYIGVNYIGLLDELTIFRRSLSAEEVTRLYREPGLLK
jgi:hypothetical protein